MKECNCGSGKESWVENDGYGIYLARVCDDCHDTVMSRYRSDIKSNYAAEEPIEPEE